jgi:hypothetical protein
MGTNVNFGDILPNASTSSGSGDYPPVPEGDYDLMVVSTEVKTTQTGKPMISLKAQVAGGEHDRRLIWDNLVVSKENPKALGILQGKLNALGFTPQYLKENNPDLEIIADALVNRSFRAKVGQSEYQGKLRNELKAYYPSTVAAAGSPAAPPMPQQSAGAAVPPPPPAPPAAGPVGGAVAPPPF